MKWFRHTHDRPRKILLLSKRWLAIPGALLCVCALCLVTTLPAYVTASAPQRQLPVYCVQRDYKVCSLTFDAAWGNEDTQELIDILDQYNVKATFFVVGDIDDLNACNDKIEAVTGVRPTLFRPPYGEYDDHVISTVRGMGIQPIQWDVDSLDWKDYDAATITQRVTEKVGPGSIVLFHNAALHTPEALPGILEYLLGQGYSIVPVSQLVLSGEEGTDYTIDHTGRQCPLP